jgi:hypothetical protein
VHTANTSIRKACSDNRLHLFEPRRSHPRCTCNYYAESLAANVLYAAKLQNASLPQPVERIAEDLHLALRKRVRSIEDDRRLCPQQPDRHALSAIAFKELVRHAGAENPVDPPLHCRGRLAPPVGVHDDQSLRPL